MERTGKDQRATILDAAASLLRDHGIDSLTTRRVAEAAGTQPPTIYRLFGDKDGLLQAVADHVLADYVKVKSNKVAEESQAAGDPLEDLREGYRLHVGFGLANPEVFALMIGSRSAGSATHAAGVEVLQTRVRRLAASGVLRVSEQRAIEMISAAGNGAILCTLGSAEQGDGLALGDAMLDAVLAVILTTAPVLGTDEVLQSAVSLAALTPRLPGLTDAERNLMMEWLGRSIEQQQG